MLLGSVDYQWRGRDVQIRTGGASTLRHHRRGGEITSVSHTAAAGVTARLPWRNTLSVNQTALYSPSYLYNLFPRAAARAVGEAPPAAPDHSVTDLESYSYETQLTLKHDLTRRTSFTIGGEHSRTDYQTTAAGQPDLDSYGTSGLLTRLIGPNTRANGRYRFRSGNFAYGGGAPIAGISTEHSLEIGVAHSWLFSRTHRMTLDLALGPSVVIPPEPPEGTSRRSPAYRLIGQLGLSYLFGRSWQASAMYRQAIDYVPGLIEPVATDGLIAGVDGLIMRRVDVRLSALYSGGKSAFNNDGTTFDSYAGDAKLRYALARVLAAYVEYLYYFYDFRGAAQLAPGIPPALERHGGRVGFTLLIPALGR
jgi:hypothetical protein